MKRTPVFLLLMFLVSSTQANKLRDTSVYKYVVVEQTQTLTSEYTFVGGYQGFAGSTSVNPADVISGILMKKGFVILNAPNNKRALLVRYGNGDGRGTLDKYMDVTIQMPDSKTHDLVFTCSAEGHGSNEAKAVRNAITQCLKDF